VNTVVDAVKTLLFNSSVLLPLLALGLGVVLLYRDRTRRWRGLPLILVLAALWTLSTPVVARWLVSTMSRGFAPLTPLERDSATPAVVVLAAGAHRYRSRGGQVDVITEPAALRVLEAARVYRLLKQPWVVVTGGALHAWPGSASEAQLMRDQLVQLGVPADRIVIEDKSQNTRDHGIYVPELLRARGADAVVLVTSPAHMSRATKVFAARGVTVVPSPAADRSEMQPGEAWFTSYLPSPAALEHSQLVLYELMGMVYYWSRGWI